MSPLSAFPKSCLAAAAGLLLALSAPGISTPGLSTPMPGWTDWADLSLSGSVVLSGAIAGIDRVPRREAADVPPGEVRVRVRVDLRSALRSPVILPAGATWLWQGKADQRGRPPFARGDLVFAFANLLPDSTRPEVQAMELVAADGQQPWTEQADRRVRAILNEARQPGMSGLMASGIRDGFRSAGNVPGESVSQYFLRTENDAPLVLVVRHEAGRQMPDILASTGDLIDNAESVRRQTLVWRALACGLPPELPSGLATDPGLVSDYLIARLWIGDCGRTRAAAPPATPRISAP